MGSQEDVEFKSREDCFELIECYKNANEIKAIADFEKHLSVIAFHHAKNGLTEEQLDLLVSFVYLKNLKSSTIKLLIQCLIPKHEISKHLVSKVTLYVLSFHNVLQPYITVFLLKWLIGILQYELTDVSAVDEFYRLFYFMLENENHEIQKYVIWVIYMLTRPEDVDENNILFITQLEFKYGKKKESQALLSLFKSYKPAQVPVSVPIMNEIDIPQYLPSEVMKNSLAEAQKRNSEGQENTNETLTKNRVPFIKLFKADDMTPKYSKNIIQTPDYEDSNKMKKRVTDLKSIVELEDSHNLDLPRNILCLLGTEPGLHLLAYGDETLQLRLAFKLNDIFNKVFIKCKLNASKFEKQLLLERVYQLQEYMMQGIFVVSKFLANYLEFWNGSDFCKQILKLVEWVTFSSFTELKDSILLPLFDVFVTSEENVMCDIISSLSILLMNMFQVDVYRFESDYKPLFLKATPGWLSDAAGLTLGPTIRAIKHFITIGSVLMPESLKLLHESINFFELLLELEIKSSFADLTIISFSLVYRSLFFHNSTPFSRICKLLLRYPTVIQHIEVNSSVENFEKASKLIKFYNADIMNCLWFNTAASHREAGIIFKEMDEHVLRKLNKIVRVDNAFSVQRHVMFLPFLVACLLSERSLSLPALMTHENLLAIIETYLPYVAALIKSNLE